MLFFCLFFTLYLSIFSCEEIISGLRVNSKNGELITLNNEKHESNIEMESLENRVKYIQKTDLLETRMIVSSSKNSTDNSNTQVGEGFSIVGILVFFTLLFCICSPCWSPVFVSIAFLCLLLFQFIFVFNTISLCCGPLVLILIGINCGNRIIDETDEVNPLLIVLFITYIIFTPSVYILAVIPSIFISVSGLIILPYFLCSIVFTICFNYEIYLFCEKGTIHIFDIFNFCCGEFFRKKRLSYHIGINSDRDDYEEILDETTYPDEIIEMVKKGKRKDQEILLKVEKDEIKRKWNDPQDIKWFELANEKELNSKNIRDFKPKYRIKRKLMKIQNYPFTEGELRKVYLMEDCDAMKERFVGKLFKDPTKTAFRGREYFREVLQQMYIKRLADEFNMYLEKIKWNERINYIVPHVIQLKQNKSDRYCYLSIEEYLEDLDSEEFTKFNNNAGMVNFSESPIDGSAFVEPVPQAFSHFTFHVTMGYLMAVDIQGIKILNGDGVNHVFLMTDPSVHCDVDLFVGEKRHKFTPGLNMGKEGWSFFFDSHNCNHICKALNLVVPKKKTKK